MKKTLLQRGFTLIELLVVIAIIALLTAIVTSNFASSKAKSRDAKRVSDIAQLQLSLALYFDKCNVYPPGPTLVEGSVNPLCPGVTFGDYISVVPRESAASPYTYKTPAPSPCSGESCRATDYVLRARLESMSSALSDDVDATTFSTTCTDTSSNYYYCVKPN